MKNIFKNKKYVLIISIISTILVLGLAGTYAWYFWSSNDEDRTRIVTSVGAATVVYEDGASLLGQNLKPVDDKTKGIVKEISVKTNIHTVNDVSFNLYLDINELGEGLKDQSFRYELWKDGVEEAVASGNFSQESLDSSLVSCTKNNTSHIVLLSNQIITKTASNYKLYIWIDGVNYTNPSTMISQAFSFKLHADGQGAVIGESLGPNMGSVSEGTLAYNIVNMYNSADKTSVYNGGIKYYYDAENKLMSDVGGNVRYYGESPDNYVYFNCSDYTNQSASTCEKWRIIGVFDGKVKIVRDESIGKYSWDITADGDYYNDWTSATVNTLLNDGYYNNKDGNIHYNGETASKVTVNFATKGIGLKNDMTRDFVSENMWYLGGSDNADVYSGTIYNLERGNDTCEWCTFDLKWNGNIGLMYPSDYGYATDFTTCNQSLLSYSENDSCKENNWIYSYGGQWFITPFISNNQRVWRIDSNIGSNLSYLIRDIRPTVYLDEDIVNYYGKGTSSSPYRLCPADRIDEFKVSAVDYITNLYLNNKNKIVKYNNIEYRYAESVNLMNDRLGGTIEEYDFGNIRYYGANPNNYVDIGDTEINSAGEEVPTLYRIIGVFKDIELADGTKKDLIKVIRADSIGNYSWDNKTDGIGSSIDDDGSNDWSDARLMMLLNPGYDKDDEGNTYSSTNPLKDASGDIIYGYEGSLWWNSKSGTCYSGENNGTKTCNFTSTGLSSNVHNKIEEVVWNLGGKSDTDIHSDEYYILERGTTVYSGRPTEWEGKVALMYPSDYGYATDLSKCDKTLFYYSNSTNSYACKSDDWLFYSVSQWQLTPGSSSSDYARFVYWAGFVDNGFLVDYARGVRPVFYLNSELVIESGEGTIEEPYVIG